MNMKGQSLIEMLVTLPLCLAVMGFLLAMLYRSWLFHGAQYHAHEALLCAQDQQVALCEQELNARLKHFIFTQTDWTVNLKKQRGQTSIHIKIFLDPPLIISRSMHEV